MTERVKNTITAHSMLGKGDTVFAGLSGGADSVCLLLVLEELRCELGFELRAVHVNHCLRGEESDSDSRFCTELCGRLNIPLETFRVNVTEFARESRRSTEEAARILRYQCFEKAAAGCASAKTATAHNKGDNTETVLFNLTRGTGIKGLSGIPYVRGNIIRPLLDVTREEIEAYLSRKGQTFVTDSTNLTDDYSRNKLRHNVIPMLMQINSNVHEAVTRLSASAAEDEAYFEELLNKMQPQDMPAAHPAVRKRYIRRLLRQNNMECSYERITELDDAAREMKNTRICLSGDVYAVFRRGIMSVERAVCEETTAVQREIVFKDGFTADIPEFDKTVIISRVTDDNLSRQCNVQKKLTKNQANYVTIQGVALLRNKRDGDCIALAGRGFTTKLKKLYNSMKIPPEERRRALVIADDKGILWSEYGGAAERAAPKDGTDSAVYEIIVRRLNDDSK